MLIFGKRLKAIATLFMNLICTNCGKSEQVLSVWQSYAHVFWIPLLPLRKHAWLQCQHCQKVQSEKELPASLQENVKRERKAVRTPLWTFTGIILFVAFALYSNVQAHRDSAQAKVYIEHPRPGDTMVVKKTRDFMLMKVVLVKGESVQVLIGNEIYSRFDQAKNAVRTPLKTDARFGPEPFEFPLSKLKLLDIEFVQREEI